MPGQSNLNSYEPIEILAPNSVTELFPCVVAYGQDLAKGTVVGFQAVTGHVTAYDSDSVSSATTPVAGATNVGDGTISAVVTDDDVTLTEDFVLTCTEESSNAGTFSVVGSVSGDLGDATVGVEFSDADAKVTFTISDGAEDFDEGDTFTFSTSAQLATVASGIISADVDATEGEELASMYVRGSFVTSLLTGLDANARINMLMKTVGDYVII